ncbi:hypothetical protein NN561_010600 [Cricetulus griseus]
MAASTWRPPYLPHELRGRGLTRPERDAEWRRGSSPPNPGVECLVTGTSARGGGGGGSGCKAGALAIKPEAAALITVFGAGQLRGACWSRSRTSLSRPALCLLVGGPRGGTQGLVHTQQGFHTELNSSPASFLLLKEHP